MRRALGSVVIATVLCATINGVGAGASGSTAVPQRDHAPVARESRELIEVSEGERLRRVDVDTIGRPEMLQDVLVGASFDDPVYGRDLNGQRCTFADGTGRFVIADDTAQDALPPGWSVFTPDGRQIGRLNATYFTGGSEPHGCAIDRFGRLFTTEVGTQGFGPPNGQLIEWFPPYDVYPAGWPSSTPSSNFCKIAIDLGTAGSATTDAAGNVYVAESSGFKVEKFSPPFPTGTDAAHGCGGTDSLGSPLATAVQRSTFLDADSAHGMLTYSGVAFGPDGHFYASSVVTGRIAEYDALGTFERMIVDPPQSTFPTSFGTPQGIAVGADGTVYYADLDLVQDVNGGIGPGPDGKAWRVRRDAAGNPLTPEMFLDYLAFPDAVTIVPGDLQRPQWSSYGNGPSRRDVNPRERRVGPATIARLKERWRFLTGAVVTASPAVARVDLGDGSTRNIAYFTSWDGNVYAVRLADGSELWRLRADDQPGASFPAASSPTVVRVAGRLRVIVAMGETMYSLDAVTGDVNWRFAAGTGCEVVGQCGFSGERNEIESSPVVANGNVVFGVDVNDSAGKGGFYAIDALTGALAWYFDPQSGATCMAMPADDVHHFDGYHSEAQLGLPTGFLATRPGCDFDRTPDGCGSVWSSAAYDLSRDELYFATANCDANPLPANDEAIVALHGDGTLSWHWQPRATDPDDLDFGATPNLFSINTGGATREVVGVGDKSGTYYVIDRAGVNAVNGVRWDDTDASQLPYWRTNVVPGGPAGGIIATAAVDQRNRRIYFSTAPGFDPLAPQQPTVHALALDTGAILWDNAGSTGLAADASFAPTSAANGLVYVGSVTTPTIRVYDAVDGRLLLAYDLDGGTVAVASTVVVVDGTVLAGTGIGERGPDPSDPGDFTSRIPSSLVALCVGGTAGCT